MNLVIAGAALVMVVVALEVLSAMRLGRTCWMLYPAWLLVAIGAFGSIWTAGPVPWPLAGLTWACAGMMWRMRGRFVWEAEHGALAKK